MYAWTSTQICPFRPHACGEGWSVFSYSRAYRFQTPRVWGGDEALSLCASYVFQTPRVWGGEMSFVTPRNKMQFRPHACGERFFIDGRGVPRPYSSSLRVNYSLLPTH